MSKRCAAEELAKLREIAEAATPGLRLTPEKHEQLRRLTEAVEHGTAPVITHEADLAARAFREIERLRRERDEAKHDVHRAQLWIASLIHLHGGQVRIPFSVLTEVAQTFTRSTDPETGDEILALLDGEKGGDRCE